MDKFRHYAGIFGSGLLHEVAPDIAAGYINEMFHKWHISVAKVVNHVRTNRSIWDDLDDSQRKQILVLAQRIGNLDFFTPNLIIQGIKKDFPGVASLFLNWPEAQDWLERQVEQLKTEVYGEAE